LLLAGLACRKFAVSIGKYTFKPNARQNIVEVLWEPDRHFPPLCGMLCGSDTATPLRIAPLPAVNKLFGFVFF
jgi:hypothetical protein